MLIELEESNKQMIKLPLSPGVQNPHVAGQANWTVSCMFLSVELQASTP